MTALQTQLRNHVDECHASMGQLWVAKLFTEAANRIDALESAIEEQTRTIGALNMCIGGRDSTSTENVTMADALAAGDGCLHARIDALEAQVAADKKYIRELEDANTPELVSLREQVSVLRNALNGFIANSCRVDWPADIYDAAIAAQKGTV
jgi:uncharacterized coiled-coil protein SlyX